MKQCPECKAVYTDENLRFCVKDGAVLTEAADASEETAMLSRNSEETVMLSPPPPNKNPLRIDINSSDFSAPTAAAAPRNSQMPPQQTTQTAPPVGKNSNSVVIGIVGAAVLLLTVGGALAAYILFRSSGDAQTVENKKVAAATSPSPLSNSVSETSTPNSSIATTTPSDDTARLREERANLQKQLQDQKNQKQIAPPAAGLPPKPPTTSPATASAVREARANSPRDGFLALRNEPNSETGYRVAQIPHGAIITVLGCPRSSNVGKIPGRWCQVVYNGQSGWAFDAFISF